MATQGLGSGHGVVVPVPVDPRGIDGPTAREAAGPWWRRTSRGRYVPAHVEPSAAQRIAEAACLLPARHVSVTGWAALSWRGAPYADGLTAAGEPRPVPVSTSRRRLRPQPLFALCEERCDPREVELVDGVPMSSAVRATCFEVRYAAGLDAAVVVLDMAYLSDLVAPGEVAAWVGSHASYTGIEQARRALPLAAENVWSPMETRLRLLWQERMPEVCLLANAPVFDTRGSHVATPDLLDPASGVAGEYDGELHLEGVRRARDLRREGDLRRHGLEPVVMVGADLASPGDFLDRLRDAYRRAAQQPVAARGWTLQQPHWWRDTSTVARRRALVGVERDLWLARGRRTG
ncbi:hypothetical protein BKA08_001758 [Nocardioides marinisabuli]|uniref:AbiEi antitoxin C-terminal domain-containing protein n=1 Tax=Nocardioides marinisabuli TaxID=419476 RepID=A0A7Y9JQJ9_9ACTN|nr:hypothetical protein [Nocardioides marinisabuli]NYD57520.1 hypothetical protein [Nocardioides marinisabuli]